MKASRTACVVGAGAAGIAALKECVRQGFETVCFELDSDIGGTWHKKDYAPANTPAIWDTLNTNTSKFNTCYSDFPPLTTDTVYLSAQAMHDYFRRAVEHFDLGKYIQLNTRVMKIRKTSDHETTGQWEVFTILSSEIPRTAGTHDNDESILPKCRRRIFDFVFVCTGYFKIPAYPDIPGAETFRGSVHHSFDYMSGKPFAGKKVLVVGNQFSALDISGDVSNYAKQVYLALGKGTWILPRCYSKSRPFDFVLTRSVLYGRNAINKINEALIGEAIYKFNHDQTDIRPPGPPLTTALGFSDELPVKLLSGRIKAFGHLLKLEDDRAHFENGTVVSGVDAVIFCTGYKPDLSFLDLKVIQESGKMELYKFMFPLNQTHNTLALIGHVGGDFPVLNLYDVQARLATRAMAGKHKLPPQDKMKSDVEFWNGHAFFRKGNYKSYFIAIAMLTDSIAQEIGCYPSFWKVFLKNPTLAYRNWYGPIMSVQYRLLGPDSEWEAAEKTCYSQYEEGYRSVRRL